VPLGGRSRRDVRLGHEASVTRLRLRCITRSG
jgi:hypothetical protein